MATTTPAGPLDALPIWGLFGATFLFVLLAIEGGFRLGAYRGKRTEHEHEGPVGAMVGGTLGLLALVLAFTFGLAASRFDEKKRVLLDEANAIGTTYLRAALLEEPARTEVRDLLREYVDVRLDAIRPGQLDRAVRRSEELHGRLWSHAVAAGERGPTSQTVSLFIQSLNELIDLHAERLMVGVRSRIPLPIWTVLYGVAMLALGAMGYHAGLARPRRPLAFIVVAAAFAAVMWMTFDLDRSQQGLFRVSQQPLIDVKNSMAVAQP